VSTSRDLVALVADSHQARVLQVLLTQRRDALDLRAISFDVHPHPRRDPGVYKEAETFLTSFQRSHRFALVMLDVEFGGSPGARSTIEQEIQRRLDSRGWGGRSQVVAIAPELEAWVWGDSLQVAKVLGQTHVQIRNVAAERGWWSAEAAKPSRPKELLSDVLHASGRRPPSAALFGQLAEHVGLQRCTDPAFVKLREVLRGWFSSP
jgi:hypothetical protein